MFVTLAWLISASAIVGNGILIYLIAFRQRLRSVTQNWFILSLAVADLFVGATYFPYNRGCNDTGCSQRHVHWLCVDLFLSASVTNVCLLTVDRYIAIVKPLQYLTFATKLKAVLAITAAWFFPIITALLPLSWTYTPLLPSTEEYSWKIFLIGTLIVYGIIPCVFLSLAIIHIILIVRKWRIQRSLVITQLEFNYSRPPREKQLQAVKEMSSVRLVVSVVVLFLTCYLCGVCVRAMTVFGQQYQYPPDSVRKISIILILANSALNPVAYGLFKDDLKKELLCSFKRVWKGGSWSRIPAPFSRESRIPHVFHQFPESRFSFPEKYIKKSNFYKS